MDRADAPGEDGGAPRWARRLARLHEARPRTLVALVLGAAVLAGWPLARARFAADLTDLLPEDSAAAQALRTYRSTFAQSDQLVIVALATDEAPVRADGGAELSTPSDWIAALRARLERRPEPARVEGGPLETLQQFATAVMPEAGFAWLAPDEAAGLRATLEPSGLARAFARSARLLEQSPGLETGELVRRDPLFLRELLAGRASSFLGGSGGRGAGGEGQLALLLVSGRRPAQDLDESRRLLAAVDAEIAALGLPDHLRLLKTGGYAIAVEDEARIRGDLTGSTLSSIVLVLAVSWLAHRRFAPVFFTAVALLLGIVWGYGLFLSLRGFITMLTAAGAAMLVGLGDDYGVHFYAAYSQARREGRPPAAARRAMLERAGPRVVVTALTSVGCFVAFGLTGFRGLADLGLLAAIGLFACLAAFLLLYPLLLRRHEPHPGRAPMAVVAGAMAELPLRLPRLSLALAAALTAVSATLLLVHGAPPFSGDARLLHPDRSPALEALAELDRRIERPLVPWVVLGRGSDPAALSERFAGLEARLRPLVDEGVLLSFELPSRALPPRAEQEAVFAALAGLDPDATARELRAQAAAAGFEPDAFAQLERSVRANLERVRRREAVTLAELGRLGAGGLADSFFRPDGGGFVAAGYLFGAGGLLPGPEASRALARVRSALADAPDLALTGFSVVAEELTERVQRDFRGVTWLAAGVVALVVLACSRSWRATVLALAPVAVAVVWLLALMRLCGVQFNVLNIVLVPMLVGLCVDHSIHLVFDARATGDPARSLRDVFPPMLVSAVTTVAGFVSLATVDHPAVASMGELAAAGIALGVLATLLVLPPLQRIAARSRAGATRGRDQKPR